MLKIKIKMQKKGKERTKRYKMQPNEMWLEKKRLKEISKNEKKMNECKGGGAASIKGGAENK